MRHNLKFMLAFIIVFIIITACGSKTSTTGGNQEKTKSQETKKSEETTTETKSSETITGTGDQVKKIKLNKGFYTCDLSCKGPRTNFIVHLLNSNGDRINSLANEISADYNGQKAVKIESTGEYTVEVKSEGKWEIKFY